MDSFLKIVITIIILGASTACRLVSPEEAREASQMALEAVHNNDMALFEKSYDMDSKVISRALPLKREKLLPIHLAARSGSVDLVRFCAKRQEADVVIPSKGVSSLVYAILSAKTDVVQLLHQKGADLNFVCGPRFENTPVPTVGMTPLMKSIIVYSNNSLHYLLKNGANPNVKALFMGKMMTPLDVAYKLKNVRAKNLLMQYGAKRD